MRKAFVSGFLTNLLGTRGGPGLDLYSFVVAAVGAVVFDDRLPRAVSPETVPYDEVQAANPETSRAMMQT